MPTRDFNLVLAEEAVNYVQSFMAKGLGPSNRMEWVVREHVRRQGPPPSVESGPSPQPSGILESMIGTDWERQQRAQSAAQQNWLDSLATTKQDVDKAVGAQREKIKSESLPLWKGEGNDFERAQRAIKVGQEVQRACVGQCGEQSCVAFKYLITRGASGLAIVNWEGANHTFVVLGMEANVPRKSKGSFMIPPVWGDTAVICDPWYHEWFAVEDLNKWQATMRRIAASANPDHVPNTLDKAAITPGNAQQLAGYAKTQLHAWIFERLVYLVHGDQTLIAQASSTAAPQFGSTSWWSL